MPVTVRLINNNRWNGIKKYPNCYTDVTPYLKKNGQLYTGFDESNPEDVKERKKFEASPYVGGDLRPSNSDFWATFFVRLTSDDLYLEPGDYDKHALQLRFLKNHKDAQISMRDKKPNAVFMIVDEVDEAKEVNVRMKLKFAVLDELKKMTGTEKRQALRLLGFNYDDSNDEIVDAKISEIADSAPQKLKRVWMDNKQRATEVLVSKAISARVIGRKGKTYFYETTPLGTDVPECAQFLDKGENSELRSGVERAVEK